MERNIAVIVSFTAGMALLMDAGVVLAIVAQIGFIVLQGVLVRNPTVADLQPILVNFALLVFLVKNYSELRAEAAATAAKEAKSKVANAAANAVVEGSSVPKPQEKEEIPNQSKPSTKVESNNAKNTRKK
jgi:hypothetical protein